MKRLLSIFMAVSMVFSSILVFAEAEAEITHNAIIGDAGVAVSGIATDAAGLPMTLKIVNENGELAYIEQMLVDGEESFSFMAMDLPTEMNYTYSLRHPRMAEPASDEFYISSEGERQEVLETFLELEVGATSTDRISIMTDFLTTPLHVTILNLDIEAFHALEDSSAVALGMCNAFDSLTNLELVSKKFAELLSEQAKTEKNMREQKAIIKSITEADLEEMLELIDTNAEKLGLMTEYGFECIKNEFENGNEEPAKALKNAIKNTVTPTEFGVAFAKVAVVVAFNEESWGKFDEIEEYYSEYIGKLFEEAEETLTDLELTELKKEMQSEEFDSIDEVKAFIEEKTEEIIDSRKSSSGSSGGGGGGKSKAVQLSGAPILSPFTPTSAAGFTDCEHVEWAKESIMRLKEKGIVNGKSETLFSPDDKTTREEFLKMLLLACDIELSTDGKSNFTDVVPNSWYAPYVSKAVELGIVTGISDTEFGVGMEITRQDMAVLCFRALGVIEKQPTAENTQEFADKDSISDYAAEAVGAMQSAGVIKGMDDNRFEPLFLATRAQTAVIIDRLMSLE